MPARIPKVSATGEWPKPYTSGVYFMLVKGLSGDKLTAAQDFIGFVTSKEKQLEMVQAMKWLPALEEALEDPIISEDPILKGSSEQMVVGTPMPTVLEMRCNWDSMKPEMLAVLADIKSPEDAETKTRDDFFVPRNLLLSEIFSIRQGRRKWKL